MVETDNFQFHRLCGQQSRLAEKYRRVSELKLGHSVLKLSASSPAISNAGILNRGSENERIVSGPFSGLMPEQ